LGFDLTKGSSITYSDFFQTYVEKFEFITAEESKVLFEYLKELKQTPINRLSIGIQSFHDNDLTYLNRVHNTERAKNCLTDAKLIGFDNISIDLIYGMPTLNMDEWQENIDLAIEYKIPHISAYSLTVEPSTVLEKFIRTGKLKALDEEKANEQFKILMKLMKENDFEHYEISNFCKPNSISRHNSNYWVHH